jgi:hypothetical protein
MVASDCDLVEQTDEAMCRVWRNVYRITWSAEVLFVAMSATTVNA